MRRRPAAAAAAVLLAAALGGCGADATESYCDTVGAQADELQRLSGEAGDPGTDLVGDTLDVFETLRSAAPRDLTDEWDTVVLAWRDLAGALDEAGIDVTQYDASGPRPAGTSRREVDAVRATAEALRSPRVRAAVDGIEQHARDVCKLDLSGSGLGF
ncbi:hypothetical protein [Nocardioides mesophilus]|uniref:Lipoprotein n=1 Tax=Nocardioides mesophilus TaxID=433659 RepID=A0A7G9RAD4_9ACTN|nr:hypothetical protein [Nocardioides mesophilus]QNN52559.1 hypothetical protein H9L09_19200 [Nocardioides mesophilus]